jgi:hypothetical protein
MADVIQLRGVCPLCHLPIQPKEQIVVDENQQEVHAGCWAASQEPARNNSY